MPNTRVYSTYNSNNKEIEEDKPICIRQTQLPTPSSSTRGIEQEHLRRTSNPSSNYRPTNNTTTTNKKQAYFNSAFKRLAIKMDLVFETCLAQDVDFPLTEQPVCVFGRSYSIHYGKDLDGKGDNNKSVML